MPGPALVLAQGFRRQPPATGGPAPLDPNTLVDDAQGGQVVVDDAQGGQVVIVDVPHT